MPPNAEQRITPSEVVLISLDYLESCDLNFIRLLNFLGIDYHSLSISSSTSIDYLAKRLDNDAGCVILNCKTLSVLSRNQKIYAQFKSYVSNNISYLLIYDIGPHNLEISALNNLTEGLIKFLSPVTDRDSEYEVSNEFRYICGPFSGLSFGSVKPKIDCVFNLEKLRDHVANLISINQKPFFISIKMKECNLFLIACQQILDISKKLTGMIDIREFFSQIVPELMFLKYVFKDRCWHTDKSQASLILDDPLLQENYGFLNYERLLETMDRHSFATTIAFIPWNFKRSSEKVNSIVRKRSDKFTICIHGCDHTNNEFRVTDLSELNAKMSLAIKRIQSFSVSSGISFDKVMIFPKDAFSTQAMKALKSNNYLAAVNTAVIPHNSEIGEIEISELLNLAVTCYGNFPLFTRRYPKADIPNFAFDLFLGKPCFIVIHHDYFKNGYDELANFINAINSCDDNICWDGLGNIIRNNPIMKKEHGQDVYVKLFTNFCKIKNRSEEAKKFIITKYESGDVPIEEVLVNGKSIAYEIDRQMLILSTVLQPKTAITVNISYRNLFPKPDRNFRVLYNAKVHSRRYLSEFRDNFLCKHDSLLAMAYRIKKFLTKKQQN